MARRLKEGSPSIAPDTGTKTLFAYTPIIAPAVKALNASFHLEPAAENVETARLACQSQRALILRQTKRCERRRQLLEAFRWRSQSLPASALEFRNSLDRPLLLRLLERGTVHSECREAMSHRRYSLSEAYQCARRSRVPDELVWCSGWGDASRSKTGQKCGGTIVA